MGELYISSLLPPPPSPLSWDTHSLISNCNPLAQLHLNPILISMCIFILYPGLSVPLNQQSFGYIQCTSFRKPNIYYTIYSKRENMRAWRVRLSTSSLSQDGMFCLPVLNPPSISEPGLTSMRSVSPYVLTCMCMLYDPRCFTTNHWMALEWLPAQ